jgi:peptidoglycan hydrolase-like protein with peptidoglycan-binding domain
VLATALIGLSLSACGMMGKEQGGAQTSSAQESSRQGMSSSAAASGASAQQQAAAPDLVRDVQRTLGARGYDAGQPDGVYGTSTQQALRKFQNDNRLNSTGQIDTQTLAALGLAGEAQAGQRAATGGGASQAQREYTPTTKRQGAMAEPQRSPSRQSANLSRDQVRTTQQNLADRGYDPGQADGVWGSKTSAAMRNFERDQNLQADGRPDPQSLAALGVETGSPSTQTGEMRDSRDALEPQRGTIPESSRNPGTVDPSQSDVTNPEQQQGLLPPTGSQAPGSAREQNRSSLNPGGSPATTVNPEEGDVPR